MVEIIRDGKEESSTLPAFVFDSVMDVNGIRLGARTVVELGVDKVHAEHCLPTPDSELSRPV